MKDLYSVYCISLNRHCPQNRDSHTVGSSERNKHRPQIVAVASLCSTCTRMRIVSDNDHWASSRAVCVVRLVFTANSKTKRQQVSY